MSEEKPGDVVAEPAPEGEGGEQGEVEHSNIFFQKQIITRARGATSSFTRYKFNKLRPWFSKMAKFSFNVSLNKIIFNKQIQYKQDNSIRHAHCRYIIRRFSSIYIIYGHNNFTWKLRPIYRLCTYFTLMSYLAGYIILSM